MSRPPIRNFDVWGHLEIFLVTEVSAVLTMRLVEQRLHLAAMLVGGMLMLSAIILLLAFLRSSTQRAASFIGGAGFGIFLDEAGKFVTRDNDYFFKPTATIVYVTFMATFLVARSMRARVSYGPEEYLVNSLRELQQLAVDGFDVEQRSRALDYLDRCEALSPGGDPLVKPLKALVSASPVFPERRKGIHLRLRDSLRDAYRALSDTKGFVTVVTGYFLVRAGLALAWQGQALRDRFADLRLIDAAQLFTVLISSAYAIAGVIALRDSRLLAFQRFEHSVLVSILLSQVFVSYRDPVSGLGGLAVDLVALVGVDFALQGERERERERAADGQGGASRRTA